MDDNHEKSELEASKIKKQKAKKKLRRLVYGSMAVGGAIGLAGMTAQAHGNASSHMEAQLRWNFDNFVIEREGVRANFPDQIGTLERLQSSQERMGLERLEFRQANNFDFAALNDDEMPILGQKVDNIVQYQNVGNQMLNNQVVINSIKQQTSLTPLSRSVLQQLQSGNTKKAIALIEDGNDVKQVLSTYLVVQLDLYNYGAIDQFSTATFTDEIISISKAGLAYQKNHAPDDLGARAGMLHNLASSTLPDKGTARPDQVKFGRDAAIEALKIRKRMGDPGTIAVAEYMVGVFDYKEGNFDDAQKYFKASLKNLDGTLRFQDIAWSKLYLGLSQLSKGDNGGKELVYEVRKEFEQSGNDYGLLYLNTVAKKFLS